MAKATKRLIDSVWTLEYNLLPNNEIEILNYSREDIEGYQKERELPQMVIIEDDNRIAKKVVIRPKYKAFDRVKETEQGVTIYNVTNQKHVFDYKT